MYENFALRTKRTVYKWWCIILYRPVYKLTHHGYWPQEKEPYARYPEPAPIANAPADPQMNSAEPSDTPVLSDTDALARANEIIARLNREAAEDEAKKQAEINQAKKQAAEQERLAAILKANERSIDPYIQEGLSKQHQQSDIH